MKKKYKGLSRKAKWLVSDDRLITVDGTDVPIIALSQAFGRTTVTYGSIDNPQQKVFIQLGTTLWADVLHEK